MLIVFGGLPGTGKTTISRALASRRAATYLRIDLIEQALRSAGIPAGSVGSAGYEVVNALAEANLSGGRAVVADCVNLVAESRAAWRAISARTAVQLIEIEVVCSDPIEHRRRVEERRPDIPGLTPPTWQSVTHHEYQPWDRARFVLDTARLRPGQAVAEVERHIASGSGHCPRPAADALS